MPFIKGNKIAIGNKNVLGKHWKWSEESKNKIKGKKPKNLEYIQKLPKTQKFKDAVKKVNQKRKGENHPHWRGGISKIKGYNAFMIKRRKIKKLGNGGSHTFSDWEILKAQYDWTCPCCKKSEPEIKLSEDHIIPISKGGSDNIENIQPLCLKCNMKKYNKIIHYARH